MPDTKPIKWAKNMPPETLIEVLEIGHKLKKSLESNDLATQKELEAQKPLLLMLLEYLIINLDNPNLDKSLIPALEKFLGLNLAHEQEEEVELEEEREEELSQEEKQRRLRLAIYEIYKIFNPNRLAGETAIENFINNVQTRGIKTAMSYEGKEFAKYFNMEDLENVASYKKSFVAALEREGNKGFGKGL